MTAEQMADLAELQRLTRSTRQVFRIAPGVQVYVHGLVGDLDAQRTPQPDRDARLRLTTSPGAEAGQQAASRIAVSTQWVTIVANVCCRLVKLEEIEGHPKNWTNFGVQCVPPT